MSEIISPRFSEDRDADVAEYRTVSGAAVGGLLLGLLSPAALVDPLAWCIPIAGILLSVWALVRIRRNAPALTGRKIALWGLWLSLCFAAAGPTDWCYYRFRIRQEARQFAALWFDLLAADRPERAFQLSSDPKSRQPLDDRLWDYYRNSPSAWNDLYRYIAPAKEGEPPRPVRTLLALGKSAQVRYFDTPSQSGDEGNELLELRYAVTFDEGGAKKTFFVNLQLVRIKNSDGRASWRLLSVSPETKPEGVHNSG